MAINLGDKDLFPYLGDYRPVNIYKGEHKVAGWKWESQSGEELHFENTYNDFVEVEIDGKSYQEGEPSPDNPVEIHSLNDFDVVSDVGRNLLLNSSYIQYRQGIEVEYKGNLATKLKSSTNNNHAVRIPEVSKDFIQGETYTYSVLVAFEGEKPDNIQLYLQPLSSYTNADGFEDIEEGKYGRIYITRKATRDGRLSNPHLHIRGGDGHVYFTKWKIEKGSKPTPWTPAPEDITESDNRPLIDKINLSLSEPLRSVGDVHDRLFRDTDGLWKVERKTKEVHMGSQYKAINELKISETPEAMKIYRLSGFLILRMNGRTTHINSTHFSYNPKANIDAHTKINHVGMNGPSGSTAHNLHFAVSEDDFPTLSSFNDWLVEEENSGTPVTLQVQLRPEDVHIETLSQELQDKLNNLKSFHGSNYVYTVVENLKPTLNARLKVKERSDIKNDNTN